MPRRAWYRARTGTRNEPGIRSLRYRHGGIVAFGRWHALAELLLEHDGLIDATDRSARKELACELELPKAGQLERYLSSCAEVGLIDAPLWERFGHVVSKEVCEQIEQSRLQAYRGSLGGAASHARSGPEKRPHEGGSGKVRPGTGGGGAFGEDVRQSA